MRILSCVAPLLAFAAGGWCATIPLLAQAGPPGGMAGGPGSPMGPGAGAPPTTSEEKDGPAEEAPKDKQALKPIQAIPAQPKVRRRLQFFELNGYMRMRADMFHRLHLNNVDTTGDGGKYYRPPAESWETRNDGTAPANGANCAARLTQQGVSPAKVNSRCARRDGIGSANLRLRLEPTLHISDTVKVHAQIDLLDNLVLGSTPDSYASEDPFAPIDLYTVSQRTPQAGINSFADSISVKQAYGHIHFGWGLDLKFGRMPNQWGMGMVANNGGGYNRLQRDDILRQLDADYGDSVDSVRLAFNLGKDKRRLIQVGATYDWAASGPTTAQLLGPRWASRNMVGQDFSAERYDNVYQVSAFVERRDSPEMLRRKLSLGRPVLNFGFKVWYRTQDVDRAMGAPGLGDGLGSEPLQNQELVDPAGLNHNGSALSNGAVDQNGDNGYQNYANSLVHRRAKILTPDLWFRANWRTLRVEIEGAAVIGSYQHRDLSLLPGTANFDTDTIQLDGSRKTRLRQGGYAFEFKYGLFDDRFHLGFDQGFASGDASPNIAYNPQSPYLQQNGLAAVGDDTGDNINKAFRFNRGYVRDLLLFREILGTTSNAVYFKPWAAFYLFERNASIRVDIEYAFGPKATSMPGNMRSYGLELDGALRYHDVREPIFLQLQYGVMFPFKGLEVGGTNAKAAQTVQAQVGIKF